MTSAPIPDSTNSCRLSFDRLFDLWVKCDRQGYIIDANDGYLEEVGHSLDELSGKRAFELIYPEERSQALQAWESSCVDDGPLFVLRARLVRGEQPTDWFDIVGRNRLEEADDPHFYFVATRLPLPAKGPENRGPSAVLLQSLIDTIPTLIYIQNVENQRLTFVNARSNDVLGVASHQLQNIPAEIMYSFFHPDDFLPADEYFKSMAALPPRGVFEHRARILHANGEYRWIRFRDSVLTRDETGRPTQILGTMEDIDDQMRNEEELARSGRRFRKVIENSFGGTTLLRASGEIVYESSTGKHVTNPAEWDQKPVWSKVHAEDLNAVFASRDNLLAEPGGALGGQCIRAYRADGSLCWFELRAVNLLDDPDVEAIVVNWLDVTERKRAEAALQLSDKRFRIAEAISRTGGWEWELSTQDVWWSDQIYAIFGVDRSTFIPSEQSFFSLVHPEDRQRIRGLLTSVLQKPTVVKFEYRCVRPDGTIRWLEDTYVSEAGEDGRIAYVRGAIRDKTDEVLADLERSRLEEAMRQAQKLESLGILAGGVAHDFNNLLTVILTSVDMALSDSSNLVIHLERVRAASQRAAELCRQLLAYAGRGKREIRSVDLNFVVHETAQLLQSTMPPQTSLHVQTAGEPLGLDGDASQMLQVVLNLITNAAESLRDAQGNVWVETGRSETVASKAGFAYPPDFSSEGPFVFVEVRDDGAGISEDQLARVFEPFFSTKMTGRGLGLAAVAGIVRSHDGIIVVRSSPGSGAAFRVYFPAGKKPTAGLVDTHRNDDGPSSRSILVVDDQAEVRQVLTAVFEANGFRVQTADGGSAALQMLEQQSFDVILLDLTMPGMNGIETRSAILKDRPHLPVVLMSGFPEKQSLGQYGDLPLGVLQKPFTPAEVVKRVYDAMSGTSSTNQSSRP